MRPRKLYHQRIIVITQRGISQVKQRAMPLCCCCRCGGEGQKKREKEVWKSRDSRGAFCYYPAGGKRNRSRTNCEPCETVNRGVTRFGGPIHLCTIGYRSCFYLSDRKRPTRFRLSCYRSRLSTRLRSIRVRWLRLRLDRVNSINRSAAHRRSVELANFGAQKHRIKRLKISADALSRL